MQTKFGGADTGNYCLWTKAWTGPGAPSGSCLNVRPYVGSESGWTSIDGQNTTVCKPARTTCQGENDFLNKECSGEGAVGDAQCGADGVGDGYCAPFMGVYRCTVPCVAYDDCKATQQGANMECQQQTLGGSDVSVCQFQ